MKNEHKLLSQVVEQSVVRVVGTQCGRGMSARLASMGLRPGVLLKVLKSAGPGPLVVAVGHSRLGLGRGIAHKIVVEAEDKQAD